MPGTVLDTLRLKAAPWKRWLLSLLYNRTLDILSVGVCLTKQSGSTANVLNNCRLVHNATLGTEISGSKNAIAIIPTLYYNLISPTEGDNCPILQNPLGESTQEQGKE